MEISEKEKKELIRCHATHMEESATRRKGWGSDQREYFAMQKISHLYRVRFRSSPYVKTIQKNCKKDTSGMATDDLSTLREKARMESDSWLRQEFKLKIGDRVVITHGFLDVFPIQEGLPQFRWDVMAVAGSSGLEIDLPSLIVRIDGTEKPANEEIVTKAFRAIKNAVGLLTPAIARGIFGMTRKHLEIALHSREVELGDEVQFSIPRELAIDLSAFLTVLRDFIQGNRRLTVAARALLLHETEELQEEFSLKELQKEIDVFLIKALIKHLDSDDVRVLKFFSPSR